MHIDPIVEEVRKNGEAFAARFNGDLAAICTALVDRERSSGRLVVNRAPDRKLSNVMNRESVAGVQMQSAETYNDVSIVVSDGKTTIQRFNLRVEQQ